MSRPGTLEDPEGFFDFLNCRAKYCIILKGFCDPVIGFTGSTVVQATE